MMTSSFASLIEECRPSLKRYEELYKHFHSHPELSNQEVETAANIVDHLHKLSPDLEVKANIGGYGVVAILRNGSGKTVLLRADMDALPIKEKTELSYASDKMMKDPDGDLQPVMHGETIHGTICCKVFGLITLLSLRSRFPHHIALGSCRDPSRSTLIMVRYRANTLIVNKMTTNHTRIKELFCFASNPAKKRAVVHKQ